MKLPKNYIEQVALVTAGTILFNAVLPFVNLKPTAATESSNLQNLPTLVDEQSSQSIIAQVEKQSTPTYLNDALYEWNSEGYFHVALCFALDAENPQLEIQRIDGNLHVMDTSTNQLIAKGVGNFCHVFQDVHTLIRPNDPEFLELVEFVSYGFDDVPDVLRNGVIFFGGAHANYVLNIYLNSFIDVWQERYGRP